MTQTLDLRSCEREPIRVPGSIQPAGWLVAVDPAAFTILCASENLTALFGRRARDVTGLSVFDLLRSPQREILEERLLSERPGDDAPLVLEEVGQGRETCELTISPTADALILEFEIAIPAPRTSVRDLRSAVTRMQRATSMDRLADLAVSEIARISGFDRVMVYRFDEDWHGEVIAERAAHGVEPYLGLHYPASDIPSQARDLYRTNWLRAISDVGYVPVPLVPPLLAATGAPLDLSTATLRSVSPIHIEYLQNMGVAATLTISLIKNGELWGLVACHHLSPRRLGFEVRAACEVLGRTFSLQIAAFDENATLSQRLALKDLQSLVYERMADAPTLDEALARCEGDLLQLVGASGAATCIAGRITCLGRTPALERVRAIVSFLDGREDGVVATASLAALDAQFADDAGPASGLLAVRLAVAESTYLLWFRPERLENIAWGGDPKKAATAGSVPGRLSPRQSFARFETIVRGRALPWKPWEVAAASDLRAVIASVVTRRTSELERLNDELVRSNSELDAFAHIASHDLKEPLRGIHNFASYLIEDYEDVLDDEGREKLQTLLRLTQRMDALIESLLHLSRVGRVDFDDAVTPLGEVVDEVLDLFSPHIKARGFTVAVRRPLPIVAVDAGRVREVFNNVISNALKYSESETPRIEIGWESGLRPRPAGSLERAEPLRGPYASARWVTISVRDNGIGVREKHLRTMFAMFKRLHAQSKYGGGTGAGLAIARRIVERFGGAIWAESVYGESTTFYFTLPEKD